MRSSSFDVGISQVRRDSNLYSASVITSSSLDAWRLSFLGLGLFLGPLSPYSELSYLALINFIILTPYSLSDLTSLDT